MPTYGNGFIPRELLVTIGEGTDNLGRYEWLLSPGTAAKHRALLRRNAGLRPSPGYSCYRPYMWQVKYKAVWGRGAADPGESSHGGFWERRQTLAIDYGNWAYCYGNRDGRDTADKRAAFYADCRAVGLTPGLISRERGYPDEPWHVIDLDPWAAVPASDGATAFPTAETPATPVAPKGTKMTIYARRDDGLVVAIPEGGVTHNYTSVEEYDRHRETVAVINGQRQRDGQALVTLPPALTDIVTMTSERLNDLILSQGAGASVAPVVNIDIPQVVIPPLDLDAVAAKVNDEADRRARERLN